MTSNEKKSLFDWNHYINTEIQNWDLFHYVPSIILVTLCPPPRVKECLGLIYIHLLLSKCPLKQSEALLDKSRSALLDCAIHVFNSVSLCPPYSKKGVHSDRDPKIEIKRTNLDRKRAYWLVNDPALKFKKVFVIKALIEKKSLNSSPQKKLQFEIPVQFEEVVGCIA